MMIYGLTLTASQVFYYINSFIPPTTLKGIIIIPIGQMRRERTREEGSEGGRETPEFQYR